MATMLVTGAAGFIGSHVTEHLLERGDRVVGIDNVNDYYDPARKRDNLGELLDLPNAVNFSFVHGDIRDTAAVESLFKEHRFDAVVHLAAMAGVRVSIEDPALYYDVNVNGTLALLQAAVRQETGKFVLASTSSVYGATDRVPFVETDPCDRPLAPYPASKRAAEMLAHSYHHIYGLDIFILRFFTVYGPRGRPDMMAFKIADSIYNGTEVPLYNAGQMHRDWTFVDDIVQGVVAAADRCAGYEIINLGRGSPVLLADFIALIQDIMGRKANLRPEEMPRADVPYTYADATKAGELLGYRPTVTVEDGVSRFIEWYERTIAGK